MADCRLYALAFVTTLSSTVSLGSAQEVKVCCQSADVACRACNEGLTVDEYCRRRSLASGCPGAGGAIFGIVVACLVFVGAVAAAIYWRERIAVEVQKLYATYQLKMAREKALKTSSGVETATRA